MSHPQSPLTPAERARVVIVIPALNEAGSIGAVLQRLPPGVAVFVVDNGSTDATAHLAVEAGATVISEPRRGYGRAVQAGIAAAAARFPADQALVILDADCADDPDLLPALVRPLLADEADFVLTDRTRDAEPGALLPHQRAGNRLATTLIRWQSGHRYADMGPFRALRLGALVDLGLRDPTFGWNVEMQLRAVQAGLRIREVRAPYRPRVGQSKISGTLRGSVAAGAKILWSVWRYR
jgi:glycosyltransferase involved in cell wall biosynthesis